jgi:hypothetical protein
MLDFASVEEAVAGEKERRELWPEISLSQIVSDGNVNIARPKRQEKVSSGEFNLWVRN